MDYKDYSQTVKYFKHVYPFADRDWKYSRDLDGLKKIVYNNERDKLWWRIKWTAKRMFSREASWEKELGIERNLRGKFIHYYYKFVVSIRRHANLPDGIVSGMGTTTWEESGEYVQLVSPAVGDILVEWLENDSENVYAQRVVEKMKFILDDYFARAEAGWSDGNS